MIDKLYFNSCTSQYYLIGEITVEEVDYMKFMKKGLAVLLAMGIIGLCFSQNVQACNKTSGCYAEGITSECGYVQGTTGYHEVTEPNGYTSVCTITLVHGPHIIKCAGCKAALRTEYRKCSEVHSNPHCYSQYNMCK